MILESHYLDGELIMSELKIGDCKPDEIIFDTNHKLLRLYGESGTFDFIDYRRSKLER